MEIISRVDSYIQGSYKPKKWITIGLIDKPSMFGLTVECFVVMIWCFIATMISSVFWPFLFIIWSVTHIRKYQIYKNHSTRKSSIRLSPSQIVNNKTI